MRRLMTIGGILFALFAVAGCGGGSDSISKEAFVKQANAMCSNVNDGAYGKIEKLLYTRVFLHPKSEGEGIRAEITQIIPLVIAEAEAQRDGMSKIDMPSEGEAQVQKILDSYAAWIKRAKASPAKIEFSNDLYNDTRELSKKFGLVRCGETAFEAGSN